MYKLTKLTGVVKFEYKKLIGSKFDIFNLKF